MTPRSRLAAWLELARLSNAPTVVSGAFCGVALAGAGGVGELRWVAFMNGALAGVFMYSGGMVLNDAVDAETDASERPGRPIPSGRVPRMQAFAGGIAALVAGVGMVATSGAPAIQLAVALAICVVLYDLSHAYAAASVVLLGGCRGLVYLLAYSAATRADPWGARGMCLLAAGVSVYTAMFSLIARREVGPRPVWTRRLAWVIPVCVLGAIVLAQPRPAIATVLAAFVLLAWQVWCASLWSRASAKPVHAVMRWIAGICLIDAAAVCAMADWKLACVPLACFLVTLGLQRRILGS